jgi:hypothetical protein
MNAIGQKSNRSDAKTLSAAALASHIRVAEPKCLVEAFFHEIDLGAVDKFETGLIDHDLDAAFLEDDITVLDFVGIVDDLQPVFLTPTRRPTPLPLASR